MKLKPGSSATLTQSRQVGGNSHLPVTGYRDRYPVPPKLDARCLRLGAERRVLRSRWRAAESRDDRGPFRACCPPTRYIAHVDPQGRRDASASVACIAAADTGACSFPQMPTADLNFRGVKFAAYWDLGRCVLEQDGKVAGTRRSRAAPTPTGRRGSRGPTRDKRSANRSPMRYSR